MACSDVLIVNELEAREMLSIPGGLNGPLQDCAETIGSALGSFFTDWPGSLLAITLGEKGSLAFERNGSMHYAPAYPVKTVDCTGSGDAFASAFCSELAQNQPLEHALRYGNAAGAFVASQTGVLNSMPTHKQLLAFIKSSG